MPRTIMTLGQLQANQTDTALEGYLADGGIMLYAAANGNHPQSEGWGEVLDAAEAAVPGCRAQAEKIMLGYRNPSDSD